MYGYCPYCAAALKRNVHEAEARSGRIIFPALIFAAVCVVVFVYLLYEWLLVLGLGIVIIALIYEQLAISWQIPSDWSRWHIVDKQVATQENVNLHLILGVIWIAGFVIAFVTQWPRLSWLTFLGIFVGIGWVALGVIGKCSVTKSRDLGDE